MSNDTRIAVDVAKAVFEIAVSDRPGHVVRRERLPRSQFLGFMAQQPPATVVMEACGSSHHWARKIQALGHRVVLLPPHHVRPYIRRNKTDRTDTKGILEASRNEEIRPVPVKTVAQQVLTSLHRLRSGWMAERTARLNAIRGLLRELGVFIPMGAREVVPAAWLLIEDADSDLPEALRPIFAEACREIREIERASSRSSVSSRPLPSNYPRWCTCAPFPASGCSSPPHSSPSSATFDAFLPAAISPAISA